MCGSYDLNSTYSLYWEFFLTGESATNQILSADMVLYGLGGVASFGHDTNNDAFVDTGAATPIALSLHSLIRGMVGQTAAALFADLDTTFEPTAAGGSFFLEPEIVHRMHGDFFHPFAFGGVIPVADGFKIVGGDDRISLIPAPATSALILSMLPGLVALIGRATGRRDRC